MKKNVRCTKAAQEWNSVEKQSNYLRIWILQFGHNFIKQVAANYTCAVTCHTREKGYFAAQPILLAELFWLDFSNLGKQKSCIGVIPRFEKEGTKPPYVCPGCSNHTHGNNMINRCNVINKQVICLT
jgi:hypothetical protein